jgi:hypothetical protein
MPINSISSSKFNKIYVIESLKPILDAKTGEELCNIVFAPMRQSGGLLYEYCPIANQAELLTLFSRIEHETAQDSILPLLHFECHGNEKGVGLYPSGDFIGWSDVLDQWRAINAASANNLIVTMAACMSFHAVLDVSILKLTPMNILLAPAKTIGEHEVRVIFQAFFKDLFATRDIDASYKKHHQYLELYLCEKLFSVAYAKYIIQGCMGEGKKQRIERILAEVRRVGRASNLSDDKIRDILDRNILVRESDYASYKNTFLLANHASNAGRFQISLEDILALLSEA